MAGTSLREALRQRGALDRVVIPPAVGAVLDSLELVGSPAEPSFSDRVSVRTETPLAGFGGLALDPGGPEIDVDVDVAGPPASPTGFTVDLKPVDRLALPVELRPATVQDGGLVPAVAGRVRVRGALLVRFEGLADGIATMRLLPPGAADAVVTLTADPAAVLIADSGFGFELPNGLVLDDSATAGPPPAAPPPASPPASATPSWRGIAVHGARLHVPRTTPLLGGRPLEVAFEIGNPAGIRGSLATTLPATGDLPAVGVRVEWDDPAATSLGASLPTLVELVAPLPVAGETVGFEGQSATLQGPPELTLRGRFARDARAAEPAMVFTLAVEGGGPDGVVALRTGGGPAAKVFVTAAALATALVADAGPATAPSGDASGTTLPLLLLAARALESAIGEPSEVVVHRVEVEGALAGADRPLRLSLEYSAAIVVAPISLPPLTIRTDAAVPLRVRYRNVRLEVNLAAGALDRLHLSFDAAEVGVEDPGRWLIDGGPGEIFDVVATRSGHGSTWFEIDLRFALELGPVKVSGATVRASFDGGAPTVTLRGLDARVELPGIIDGSGRTGLGEDGIDLALAATLIPLQIGALVFVGYDDVGGVRKVLLGVAVDLPGPLPLANTGLGIYGLLGFFVVNGTFAPPPPDADPIEHLLEWKPWQRGAFGAERGEMTFGLGAVIGTVPDLGYAFSSKVVLAVSVPDVAVRASLAATILGSRLRFADIDDDDPPVGAGLRGALAVDASGVTIALRATYVVPKLLLVDIPFGARFPTSGSDWFVHLGADGVNGRSPGPIQATVLPGLLDIGGWAFLMVRGGGTPDVGGIPAFDLAGFSVAFGFGIRTTMGALIVRLDLSASVIVGVGTNPLVFIGRGRLDGSLHLGPVSIGVSAEIDLQVGPGDDKWLRVEVCGEVDLFFFDLRGCVEIDVGHVSRDIPPPSGWPLDRVVITDHKYGDAVELTETEAGAPTVWPDAIPLLQFTTGPANGLDGGSQFAPVLAGSGPGGWAGTLAGDGSYGSHDLRYSFRLTRLELLEVSEGTETPVAGGLEAAWQLPKHGNPKNRLPGARELALLTWEPHLWTRALPDGGGGLAEDPLDPLGEICLPQPSSVAGWALGGLAERDASGDAGEPWLMPPEPAGVLLAVLHVSEFEVAVTVGFRRGRQLGDIGLVLADFPGGIRPGGPVELPGGLEIADRSFAAALALPWLRDSSIGDDDPFHSFFAEVPLRASMAFSDMLHEPLVVVGSSSPSGDPGRFPVFGLLDQGGAPPEAIPFRVVDTAGFGDVEAYVFGPPEGTTGPYVGAFMEYDARLEASILGVRGLAQTAAGAASAMTVAAGEAASKLADRAADPPGAGRTLLKKSTTYKLVVGQQATGSRSGQPPVTFPDPGTPFERTFWFRTAGPSPSPVGSQTLLELIFKRRDVFDPSYLERYLLGYTPGDHAEAWFTGDPVAAHFDADHVAQLASIYGRDVLLRCLRTDTAPGQAEEPQDFAGLLPLTAIHLALAADRRLRLGLVGAVVASGRRCDLPPTGGATLLGDPVLAPAATYDLAVAFPQAGQPDTGTALRGGVFTTSRWGSPEALLGALGFVATPGPRPGDVPVEAVAPFSAGETVGDLLIQQALAVRGLERWPVATAARTSAMWSRGPAGWLLSGVLLEAPEPIHRPDVAGVARLTIDGLACPGGSFGPPISDAAGSRILFEAPTPFLPAGPLELSGAQQAIPTGPTPTPPVPFTLRAEIATVPRFAEDL